MACVTGRRPRTSIARSDNPGLERQGWRAVARKAWGAEVRGFTFKWGKNNNTVIKTTRGDASEDLAGPVSGLLNHFLLFGRVSGLQIPKLLSKPGLSEQLPARGRAERTARHGTAPRSPRAHTQPGGRPARREAQDAARRGDARPSGPARLPQGADEAVDRALRVQGHDVPDVEEAGHFIGHAASCSGAHVLPLLCALAALSLRGAAAAEAEWSARLQRRERPQRARRGTGCRLSPAPRAGSEAAAADTPRRAQPGRRGAGAAASRQVSCSFPKFALRHLRSSSRVLRAPSLLCAPPPPALPPGRRGLPPSLRAPSGGISGPGGGAHWAQGRRGAWSARPIRAQRPGAERGRGGATPGRPGHPGSRAAAAPAGGRGAPREALEGWRGPRAREAARDAAGPAGEAQDGGRTAFPQLEGGGEGENRRRTRAMG